MTSTSSGHWERNWARRLEGWDDPIWEDGMATWASWGTWLQTNTTRKELYSFFFAFGDYFSIFPLPMLIFHFLILSGLGCLQKLLKCEWCEGNVDGGSPGKDVGGLTKGLLMFQYWLVEKKPPTNHSYCSTAIFLPVLPCWLSLVAEICRSERFSWLFEELADGSAGGERRQKGKMSEKETSANSASIFCSPAICDQKVLHFLKEKVRDHLQKIDDEHLELLMSMKAFEAEKLFRGEELPSELKNSFAR